MAIIAHGRMQDYLEGKRPSKYHNKKIRSDGYVFDSIKESHRFAQLRLMERHGEIKSLVVHPVFEITVNGEKVCNFIPDFSYLVQARKVIPEGEVVNYVREKGMLFERIVEDCKGFDKKTGWNSRTPVYLLKKKLLCVMHGIEVHEI